MSTNASQQCRAALHPRYQPTLHPGRAQSSCRLRVPALGPHASCEDGPASLTLNPSLLPFPDP